jgi:hypothetical protein
LAEVSTKFEIYQSKLGRRMRMQIRRMRMQIGVLLATAFVVTTAQNDQKEFDMGKGDAPNGLEAKKLSEVSNLYLF